MKVKFRFLLVLTAVLTLFISCKDIEGSFGGGPLNDVALIEKYNAYVALSNSVSPDVWLAYSKYIESVDTINGTLVNKNYFTPIFGDATPYEFHQVKTLQGEKPELKELEALGVEYMEAFERIRTPLVGLIKLQVDEALTDNDYAVLREKNPEILKAFKDFVKVDTAMDSIVQEMANDFTRLELESYKENGQEIRYTHLLLIESVRDHLAYIGDYTYLDMDTMDKEVYSQKTNEIVTLFATFNEKIEDKGEVNKQVGNPSLMHQFTGSLEEYIKVSKDIDVIINDKAKHNKLVQQIGYSGSTEYKGTPDALLRIFSDIIRDSNLTM